MEFWVSPSQAWLKDEVHAYEKMQSNENSSRLYI